MYKTYLKRPHDLLLSLVVTSQVFIITWLSLTYQNMGRPFFFQERPGKV
jgi:undecaprenyl phosphate N,N'-diacetylbacillosamine 1-phosphate transferase